MKLESQVITIDQAKRLKELGIVQNSLFSWLGNETPRLMEGDSTIPSKVGPWIFVDKTSPANSQDEEYREDVCITEPIAAALTFSEVFSALPRLTECYISQRRDGGTSYVCRMFGYSGFESDKAVVSACILLIHLLEAGKITAAEVNQRLTSD